MHTPTRSGTTARRALLVGCLIVVLASLFGMHALDSHGAGRMDTISPIVMSASETDRAAGVHDHMSFTDQAGAAEAPGTRVGHAPMDMGIAGMCLAVLALALLALLQLSRAPGGHPVLWIRARPAAGPEHRGRDPDPPSLVEVSIQRC